MAPPTGGPGHDDRNGRIGPLRSLGEKGFIHDMSQAAPSAADGGNATACERARDKLRQLPVPEPVGGTQRYLAERQRALAASPEKRANFEKFASATRKADVDYLPIKLDMENVSRCNFHCTMCVVSDWPKGRRAADMSLAEFKRLVDEQIGLLEIKLQGIGEPLMQGDDFFGMIRYARARHIWVRTTTNASLLHLHDNHRKLIDSDVCEVQISIDGADRRTFEAIRRGAVFDRVISNCRLVNDYCRARGVERTKMWTVVQAGNVHQLESLVDLAADVGFTNQVLALNLSDWGMEAWKRVNEAVTVQDDLDIARLHDLVDRGTARGVKVRFWTVNEKYRVGNPATLCPWPFERAYISSDMRVVPCCYVGNPDVLQIDDRLDDKREFSAVWKSGAYRQFRQAHLDGRPPAVCQGCYAALDASPPNPSKERVS